MLVASPAPSPVFHAGPRLRDGHDDRRGCDQRDVVAAPEDDAANPALTKFGQTLMRARGDAIELLAIPGAGGADVGEMIGAVRTPDKDLRLMRWKITER